MKPSTPSKRPSQLRIIGGQWRGRKLAIADVDGLRPTGDRIRETLFNWLMPDIPGSHCLDLFAGSGALGLECLSRGASEVTLLEKHPLAAKELQKHCATLNTSKGRVVTTDSLQWLKDKHLPPQTIDVVFIDPPFAHSLWKDAITALADSGLLKEGAAIYIESPKNQTIHVPSHWLLHREKSTGQVCYRLYYQTADQ